MRACCSDPANRDTAAWDHPDETCEVCRVCGARHYTHHARPGHLGLRGMPMGAALATLTPAECGELEDAATCVTEARDHQRAVIRRILSAHGLDPDGTYDVLPGGQVRRHVAATVN